MGRSVLKPWPSCVPAEGGKAFDLEDLPEWEKQVCACAVGAGFAIIVALLMPWLARKVKRDMEELNGKT